ncbi:MAG: hypothetical protein RIQ79_1108 [Verrucomicrobiota bacterium]
MNDYLEGLGLKRWSICLPQSFSFLFRLRHPDPARGDRREEGSATESEKVTQTFLSVLGAPEATSASQVPLAGCHPKPTPGGLGEGSGSILLPSRVWFFPRRQEGVRGSILLPWFQRGARLCRHIPAHPDSSQSGLGLLPEDRDGPLGRLPNLTAVPAVPPYLKAESRFIEFRYYL